MTTKKIPENIKKTVSFIQKRIKIKPEIAVITGSGLSAITDIIKNKTTIPYGKIPNFAESTVAGHKGELVFGSYNGKNIIIFNGRLHFYEGYTMKQISYPVRILKELGVKTLIITCAVGSINKKYEIGDIIAVKDHINFTGDNPLIGEHFESYGERFPDLTSVYDIDLLKKAKTAALKNKIRFHCGTYFAVKGPSYETSAEIAAFFKLGGDVVGMSLVAETITAAQANLKVLALTYVANKAAGLSKNKLTHGEVLKTGITAGINITEIIKNVIGTSK